MACAELSQSSMVDPAFVGGEQIYKGYQIPS